MRTQQVQEPVIRQAKRDREKISEKRAKLLADYQVLRTLYFKVESEEIEVIQILDDLYKKPALSKRDLIIMDNYQNLFEYDEAWEKAREKIVKAQDVNILNERVRLGNEVFLVMDMVVEKRNQFSFSDNRIWFWINQAALLLRHFSLEKELYGEWSSLRERYHGLIAKKRTPLTEDWRSLVKAFENLQKQVLDDAKTGKESDTYSDLRQRVTDQMKSLNDKVGSHKNQVIVIDDTESDEGV